MYVFHCRNWTNFKLNRFICTANGQGCTPNSILSTFYFDTYKTCFCHYTNFQCFSHLSYYRECIYTFEHLLQRDIGLNIQHYALCSWETLLSSFSSLILVIVKQYFVWKAILPVLINIDTTQNDSVRWSSIANMIISHNRE